MAADTPYGNRWDKDDLMEVFEAFGRKTARETYVASLGIVKSLDGSAKTAKVALLPLGDRQTKGFAVTCDLIGAMKRLEAKSLVGRVCIVVFTNLPSRSNLEAIRSSKEEKVATVQADGNEHNPSNGIIVALGDGVDGTEYSESVGEASHAVSAGRLDHSITLEFTGDVTGSAKFDGSESSVSSVLTIASSLSKKRIWAPPYQADAPDAETYETWFDSDEGAAASGASANTLYATYKRYNGTDWDTVYFATVAAQVGESASRFFVKPAENTVNGLSFSQHGGITITGSELSITDAALGTYVTAADTLDNALKTLQDNVATAIAAAASNIPDGVLTADNYAATLDGVYQPLDSDLTTLADPANLANGSTLGSTAKFIIYDPATSTFKYLSGLENLGGIDSVAINGSSSNVSIGTDSSDGIDIDLTINGSTLPVSGSDSTTIESKLTSIEALATGKNDSYVISVTDATSGVSNSQFTVASNDSTQTITVPAASVSSVIFSTIDGTTFGISDLTIGDVIFTAEPGVKDFWYGGTDSSGNAIFYAFDADTVTVSSGYSSSSATAISGKGVAAALATLDSSVDAGSGKYIQGITETDGKLTAVTTGDIPTSLPASNTVNTYSATDTNPISGQGVADALDDAVSSSSSSVGLTVSLGGTVGSPTISLSASTQSPVANGTQLVTSGRIYEYVTARATKVYCQADEPTDMIAGDMWIDI